MPPLASPLVASDVTDAGLVVSAKAGNLPALDALLRHHQPWIFNLALRMVWRREVAEDATQEILLKAVTHLGGFEGRSVGLGLATVFGIVQQHRGWVAVESAVGTGSSFQVFLPAAPPDAAAESRGGPEAVAGRGHETILLVEDEPAVREFTAAVLQQNGYRVLQASSGPEALEVWQWHGARVRLLLTDMVLEDHMTGAELAAKLRAENPGLKVICTSGHRRETLLRFPALSPGGQFLQKPCRPQTLLAAVRTLLDEPTS